MKLIKRMQLLFVLLLVCIGRGIVSEIDLSLTEANRLALEQNQSLQITKEQYKASLARVKQSEAKNSPQMGIELKPSTGIGGGNTSLRTQIGFNFSQPLPGSPDLIAATKINDLDLRLADRGLQETRRQLLWQVETAYYNLLKAEQLLLASNEGVRRAEAQLKTSQLQEEVGTGTRLDVMRMQVALARSKQGQLEAQNNVRKASSALTFLLGLPADTIFKTSKPESSSEIPPMKKAFALIANRREVFELEAAVQKAKLALEQAQRQKEMKLSLVSSFTQGKGDLSLGIDKQSINGNIAVAPLQKSSQPAGWEIGVQASWNLADGGAKDAAIEEAEAFLASQQGQLLNKMTELEQEIRSLYWDLEAVQAKLNTAEANLNTTKEAWDVAKLKFDSDAGSASELLDVEVSLAEAQAEYINAYFDFLIKQRQLLFNLCLEGEVL